MKHILKNISQILFYTVLMYFLLWFVWGEFHIPFKTAMSISLTLGFFLGIINAILTQVARLIRILMKRFNYTEEDLKNNNINL